MLPLLAQNFDYVIVDTSAGLDERTLAAIDCATDLLLVSSLDVTSIRSLRKALDALDHIGVKTDRKLILNRADSKVGLTPSDPEEAIGMKISCSIPSSREIPLSLNLGTPVVISEPKSPVAKQLQRLAQLYAPVDAEQGTEGVAAMSLTERINQAQQAAAQRGDVASKWRLSSHQTRDRRWPWRLQSQGPRRPVRAPRHQAVRGVQRGPTALVGARRDRRAHGRHRDGAVT